jgi:NAD-dependent dihydropyrimidine dehydrogenase PreA subunit
MGVWMVKRKIIKIDEEKCNGCGQCIPNCPEGALQIIDNKARLVSDLSCDGLGACIGHCPLGAIDIEEREAEPYDEVAVMKTIIPQGTNTIKAHLEHLKDHNQTEFLNIALEFLKASGIKNPLEESNMQHGNSTDPLPCGCPGSAMREVKPKQSNEQSENDASNNPGQVSALRQWPVQLHLLPPQAPFFDNAHLLVAADCVPFATPDFHSKLLHGKAVCIGCPKFDDINEYEDKLTDLFKMNDVKSVTVAIMEVPCCGGMYEAVKSAITASGKDIPLIKEVVSVSGEIQ